MEPNLQPPTPQAQPEDSEPVAEPEQVTKHPYFNEETFTQPEQTPELAEPVVTANAFSPLSRDTSPENTPTTPLSSEQTAVISTTPVDVITPETVVQPSKKKSLLWLWLTLGASLLIVAGLLAGFFVTKSAADTAAHAYTSSVTSYLDNVYDAATSAATNPSDVQKAIETIKAPVLASTPLGSVSGDYTAAGKLQTEVTGKVDALVTKIKGYAQVHAFYTDYLGLYTDLRTLDTSGAAAIAAGSKSLVLVYLNNFRDKLDEVKNLSTKVTVPSELRASVADLGRVFGEMHTNWSAMVSAFNSGNSAAYDAAYANYKKSNSELSDVQRPVTEYFDALSSKTHDSAKELQAYRNTIK